MLGYPFSRRRLLHGFFAVLFALVRTTFAQTPSAWVMGSNGTGQLSEALTSNPTAAVTLDTFVTAVAVGNQHTLYIKTSGALWGIGGNAHGELGVGDTSDRRNPVQISVEGTSVIAVAAGASHSLFITSDGSLWGMGDNTDGQLGVGDNLPRATPTLIATDVSTVAAGDHHTLFIKTDGSLWSTGRNDRGQLGDATTTSRHTPAQITTGATHVSGGVAHTLFIKAGGALWACGDNRFGQLGIGSLSDAEPTPKQVIASGITAISAGATHSLLLLNSGSQGLGMGSNAAGQISPTLFAAYFSTPTYIGTGYSAIAAGANHSLTIHSGLASGLGDNRMHQSGDDIDDVAMISARGNNSACLKTDGSLIAFGDNSSSQLGGSPTATTVPVQSDTNVAAVSHGGAHTLLLKTDGTLWSRGDNSYGQLGVGDTLSRSAAVQIASDVSAISAGAWHSLYLKTDGSLWAFGRNDKGQLGVGNFVQRTTAAQITTGVSSISAGGMHSLFIKAGALWGMGDNTLYQLSSSASSSPASPVQIANSVTACFAGYRNSFWIRDYVLYGSGNNDRGQLGNGEASINPSPSTSRIANGVVSLATTYGHTLFLKFDGTLWAMGDNSSGQLGDGTTTRRLSPVQIATGVVSVAAGGLYPGPGRSHSLFLKTDGSLWAVGANAFGQLGDGTRLDRSTPVLVSGASYVTAFGTGDLTSFFIQSPPIAPAITTQPLSQETGYGAYSAVSVKASGGFLSYQWYGGQPGDTSRPVPGATSATLLATTPFSATDTYWVRVYNDSGSIDSETATVGPRAPFSATVSGAGALGYGALGESLAPYHVRVPIPLNPDIAALAHSQTHTLILKRDGTLWGVGQNSSGQLGLGDATSRAAPVQIAFGVAACSVGSDHSLFLKTDATLWAMGSNSSGELGDGTTTNRNSPVQIATSVRSIAAGGSHSLFLKNDATLWGTGRNSDGQLGKGTTTNLSTPAKISDSVLTMSAGAVHSVFLRSDNSLWSMGSNSSGQLGDGSTTNRTTPVQVATEVTVLSAHPRGNHSLFITADGTLLGMGENGAGQLGIGDTNNRYTPTIIDIGVSSCSAGGKHSLWTKINYSLWATGDNYFGQLGVGAGPAQLLPREVAGGVKLAVATAHSSWFVKDNDSLFGFGCNQAGQLGATPAAITAPVTLAHSVADIGTSLIQNIGAVGRTLRFPESRRLSADGSAWSSLGQRFDDTAAPGVVATGAARLVDMPIFKQSAQGAEFANGPDRLLFLQSDGSLWGAGVNTSGELGTGDTTSRPQPVQISANVADAVATGFGTTFLKNDATLWTTGRIASVGGGSYSYGNIPLPIDTDVISITASYGHVIYLKKDGSLWGFGDTVYGQLGTTIALGGDPIRPGPVRIATNVSRYVAGQRHTLLVKTDGTLWACGTPIFGQLGVSTPSSGISLTQITTGVADVTTSAETSFIIKTNGIVWATGQNALGQAGLGTTATTSVFTQVRDGTNQVFTGVAKIIPALSGETTFFLRTDGSLWGTGRNDRGQLGLGHTNVVNRPVQIRAQAYDVASSGLHTLILHAPASVALPAITNQPISTTALFGDFASLAVTASGDQLLTYQWYRGTSGDTSQPVLGATDSTLRLPAFVGTTNYWARVTNAAGSADSDAATITVEGAGTSAFRNWAETAGLAGSRLSVFADPDGDGLPNLLEYAFATAPNNTFASRAPTADHVHLPEGDFLVLTHRLRKNSGVSFAYERSSDLKTWNAAAVTPIVVDPNADGDGLVEEVSVALLLAPDEPTNFLRLQITSP